MELRRSKTVAICVFLIASTFLLFGGADVMLSPSVSVLTTGKTDEPRPENKRSFGTPIDELPDYVVAPKGELTLFADYKHTGGGSVPLYLVNRTKEPIRFYQEELFTLTLLHVQLENSEWTRAQEYYSPIDIYGRVSLSSGSYIVFGGKYPAVGNPCKVYYRAFFGKNVVSNIGTGFIDDHSIQLAKYDDISVSNGTPELIADVLLRDSSFWEDQHDARYRAFRRLRQFTFEEAKSILDTVLTKQDIEVDLYYDVLQAFSRIDLKEYREFIGLSIANEGYVNRVLLLDYVESGKVGALQEALIGATSDPTDPHLHQILRILSHHKRPEVQDVYDGIVEDNRYPEFIRLFSGYYNERLFGDSAGVGLKAELESLHGDDGEIVVFVRVILTNDRNTPIHFSYDWASEILGFWATDIGGNIIKARPGVEWFTRGDATESTTDVTLENGESHAFTIELSDYFDVRDLYGEVSSIVVRCKIPGIHESPFLEDVKYTV